MPRSVNAVASRRRRKKILKQTKGNFLARRNVYTVAKNTLEKGWQHAYRDRKRKKGEFRALWIQRINAAVREEGMTYSEFIGRLKEKNIARCGRRTRLRAPRRGPGDPPAPRAQRGPQGARGGAARSVGDEIRGGNRSTKIIHLCS